MPRIHVRPRVDAARVLAVGVAALVLFGSLAGAQPSAVAAPLPNLVVPQAAADRATVAEGDALRVTFAVANKGKRKAGRTQTRFYLTRDWATSLRTRKTSTSNPRSAPE